MEEISERDILDCCWAVMRKCVIAPDYPIALFFYKKDAMDFIKNKKDEECYIIQFETISE